MNSSVHIHVHVHRRQITKSAHEIKISQYYKQLTKSCFSPHSSCLIQEAHDVGGGGWGGGKNVLILVE